MRITITVLPFGNSATYMKLHRKEWIISAGGGVLIAATCAGLSSLGLVWAGMIFLPGGLLAALVFPEGIEGNSPILYMVTAFVLTATLVTLLLSLAQQWWLGRKQAEGKRSV